MDDTQLSGQDLPYTNRELREKWHDQANFLQSILNKVTLTNGRVSELELQRARYEGFYRAMAISGAIGWGIAMSLVGWMLLQLIGLDGKIQLSVDHALSAYDITK